MKYQARRMLAVAVLTGGLLISSSNVSAASFKDLKNDFWATDEISYLVENKIVQGFPDGTFNPNKTVTKAQSAIMLARALELPLGNYPDPGFKDVSKNHYAYKEIAAVVSAGIFDKGAKFNPNEEMTREAVAKAIAKAFKLQNQGQVNFKDVPTTSNAYKAIASLAERDITTGYADGTFKPNKKVTRAEFSTFIARALSTDYLPNKYNVPLNVNPAANFFHIALKKPNEAKDLFIDRKFNMSFITRDAKNFELIEVKDVARKDGLAEFLVKFKVELKAKPTNGYLKEGENQLYIVIKRNGFMNFKIISVSKESQLTKEQAPALSDNEALKLFKASKNSYWYVVMGGEGKRNEATFTYNGKTYRYMAESLNTMEKLKNYLGKTYTSDQVTAIIKQLGIIEYKGVLAQPDADGGSALNFDRAKIKLLTSTANSKKYTLSVPIGDSKDIETLEGVLYYENGKGWRVYSLQTVINSEMTPDLASAEALQLFKDANKAYWYVLRGGDGKVNEERFMIQDQHYRYMAESLNTMSKLKQYLGNTFTNEQVEALIKKLGIVEYKGVLAQPDADGGSILNYDKATLKEVTSTPTSKKFTLTVPLGETKENATLKGEVRFENGKGWRVYSLETIINGDNAPSITSDQALQLFSNAKNSYWYVVMGGEGKRNEARFKHNGKPYRFMAETLNTMTKLKKYLGYIYTPEEQDRLIKELGIIEYNGVLAQPDADGGSALNFEKAKIKMTSSTDHVKQFELTVPIGDSNQTVTLIGELRYVKDAENWLVHRLEERVSKR